MSDADPGPQPDPEIEPGEPNPGGPDAQPDSDGVTTGREPLARDLDPDDNPAVEDALPDEMKQPEDTETKATESEDGEDDTAPEEDSPA